MLCKMLKHLKLILCNKCNVHVTCLMCMLHHSRCGPSRWSLDITRLSMGWMLDGLKTPRNFSSGDWKGEMGLAWPWMAPAGEPHLRTGKSGVKGGWKMWKDWRFQMISMWSFVLQPMALALRSLRISHRLIHLLKLFQCFPPFHHSFHHFCAKVGKSQMGATSTEPRPQGMGAKTTCTLWNLKTSRLHQNGRWRASQAMQRWPDSTCVPWVLCAACLRESSSTPVPRWTLTKSPPKRS